MSSPNANKKIGGEYGEVRANIDAGKLNAYLAAHVPAVAAPVSIKQFKVCVTPSIRPPVDPHVSRSLARFVSWASSGGARVYAETEALQSNPTYFLTDARCVPFPRAATEPVIAHAGRRDLS